jgi:3-oxocholest-4-en-26-oate---CoA ligase
VGEARKWNIAEFFEAIAARIPDEVAIIDRGTAITWGAFEQASEALAADLVARGITEHGRVGVALHNCAEYLISYFACFKARCVPFNINYRYTATEVRYLVADAAAEVLVVDDDFVATARDATSDPSAGISALYVLGDPGTASDLIPLDDVCRSGRRMDSGQRRRQPDDEMFLYTGGTTGMPKAVVWHQSALIDLLAGNVTAASALDRDDPGTILETVATARRLRSMPAAPMMHATGLLSQLANLMAGGCTVFPGGRSFDAARLLRAAADQRVNILVIVGDAMGRPIVAELDRVPGAYDLAELEGITSSGTMWSRPVKAALLRHLPNVSLYDAYGSSEGSGLGVSLSTGGELLQTAKFVPGRNTLILDDDDRPVAAEPGVVGRIATGGPTPERYHGDPERSARVFLTIDGKRYSVPGDYVRVRDDGGIDLLGRGASCINSGGEKIYPEEIEEVLKEHGGVADACCVGLPDPRFGQIVCALVEPVVGASPSEPELIDFVKERAARYKAPRHIVMVETLDRLPNGKLDRTRLTGVASARIQPDGD